MPLGCCYYRQKMEELSKLPDYITKDENGYIRWEPFASILEIGQL